MGVLSSILNTIHVARTRMALEDACLTAKIIPNTENISAGTTKSSPGTVSKWLVVKIAGTTHYIPAYTSTTS